VDGLQFFTTRCKWGEVGERLSVRNVANDRRSYCSSAKFNLATADYLLPIYLLPVQLYSVQAASLVSCFKLRDHQTTGTDHRGVTSAKKMVGGSGTHIF